MPFTFLISLDSRILLIKISKESKKALSKYLSLVKFKSIKPFTFTSFIIKTFSSDILLVEKILRNKVAVKRINIYLLKNLIEYFIKK